MSRPPVFTTACVLIVLFVGAPHGLRVLPGPVPATAQATVTHGPILGRLSEDGVGIWIRTSAPADFVIRYRSEDGEHAGTAAGRTALERDQSGWALLSGLRSGTAYTYTVAVPGGGAAPGGSFRTLPAPESFRHPVHNPRGLFNFSFEHGACNFQFRRGEAGYLMPAYQHMLEHVAGKIHFQIMNGDWLYEARRDTPVEEWRQANGVPAGSTPRVVGIAPGIVGIWENYKLYLERSEQLAEWHRKVPTFFTFDDHEILNDINGTGLIGFRHPRTVFRDVGVQAWRDYLGWSNPLPPRVESQGIVFGRATLREGSGVLYDPEADFTRFDPELAASLHVHWNDDHPAAGVYEIERVLDRNRLQIRPAPSADGRGLSYSVGMRNHFRFRVGNAEFFLLDTRSHRDLHDIRRPAQPGISMIGGKQKRWLLEGMRKSDADFFFVVSEVAFTIPHIDPEQPEKDESWTVYLEEREELMAFWESLGKPVFLLTGDLHNSFAVQVSDRIWEFLSSPHNSPNHYFTEEGNRPPSGDFEYNGRKVNIRWSSFWLDDVPAEFLRQPYYSVVKINNVFNNPDADGRDRWVAFPQPQVIFQYYDGLTGELAYAESVPIPPRE